MSFSSFLKLFKKFSDLKEVIELFSFDNGSNTEEIEKSVCDPNDREKGLECLRLVKRFGNYIEDGKFQAAAKLAMSSNVFYSINTLERLRKIFSKIFFEFFSSEKVASKSASQKF